MKKEYVHYTDITREILDTIKVGDLVKINDWTKPLRVKAVSENYFVMVSNLFGKPMVDLLTKHNATVLWCNSHTKAFDLEGYILAADVIISATGKPQLIKKIRDDQIVIDVGICRGEDGKLCGDVDKSCYGDQMLITPVPGGVGLMTRVALLENLVYGGN